VEKAKLLYLNLPLFFKLNNSGRIYAAASRDFLLLIEYFTSGLKP
jgi:hypothetical protein